MVAFKVNGRGRNQYLMRHGLNYGHYTRPNAVNRAISLMSRIEQSDCTNRWYYDAARQIAYKGLFEK